MIMMRMILKKVIVIVSMLLFVVVTGCGASDIGEECDTSGSIDDCVGGAICTAFGTANTCYKLCKEQTECSAEEDCNGVSGSNLKSCQPKTVKK
jgi:hypothetical protein